MSIENHISTVLYLYLSPSFPIRSTKIELSGCQYKCLKSSLLEIHWIKIILLFILNI